MNPHLVYVVVALVLPFTEASYGHAQYGGHDHGHAQDNYYQTGVGNGVEALINAAGNQQSAAGSLTAAADVGSAPSAQAGLAQANAQIQALNANSNYQNLKNSDAIAERLAENNLAANIRQGNINLVAPNVVGQTAFRSLLVPHGMNNHQVIATQPLQPIFVNQPGSPPAQVSSGPPAVVRASPIVYKLKPSIIYQQEVINKVPTPLSLNPVYVKVYKPGKQVDAPVSFGGAGSPADGSISASSFGGGGSSAGASAAGNDAAFETSHFSGAAQSSGFGGQSSGFGAQSSGFGAQSSGFGSQSSGFGSQSSGFGSQSSGFGSQPAY